jgi:cytochrome c-type biogenesis protein CcmH/NrfG
MSAPMLRPTGQAAAETELLAQLGLPASASPEDVDQLHQAVSDYLSSAPPEIRGWARAQVAALDAAYITLTDPAGLEGSALRSPASPPVVVPGGPATPPARRGSAPEAASPLDLPANELEIEGEPSVEDLAALYAMVTPSAHDDMKPVAKKVTPAAAPVAAQPAITGTAPAGPNIWKRITLGGVAVIAIFAIGFGANTIVNGSPSSGTPGASQAAEASSGAPAVDEAKVADLMGKLQANPKDVATLMALADEFYAGGQFETSATWLDKVLALEPENIQALLARGAVYFNLNDLANSESTWKKVATQEPDNVEVHYDLGFLYLNQANPDWAGVQAEWTRVIELDPSSQLAQTVRSHLDSLAKASMVPGSSTAPGASPVGSPAASSAPSAAPSAAPAASPAASTTP